MCTKDAGIIHGYESELYRCPHCRRRVDLTRIYQYRYYFEDIRGWMCFKCDAPNDFALKRQKSYSSSIKQSIFVAGDDTCWVCEFPRDGSCRPCWVPEKPFGYDTYIVTRHADDYCHPQAAIEKDEGWVEDGELERLFKEAEEKWLWKNTAPRIKFKRSDWRRYTTSWHDF